MGNETFDVGKIKYKKLRERENLLNFSDLYKKIPKIIEDNKLEELAEKLERSLDSVTHKLSRLNIGRQSYEWTEEKDYFLSNNISSLAYRELAEKLGTTIPSVRARCKKMDIKK